MNPELTLPDKLEDPKKIQARRDELQVVAKAAFQKISQLNSQLAVNLGAWDDEQVVPFLAKRAFNASDTLRELSNERLKLHMASAEYCFQSAVLSESGQGLWLLRTMLEGNSSDEMFPLNIRRAIGLCVETSYPSIQSYHLVSSEELTAGQEEKEVCPLTAIERLTGFLGR